MIAASLGKIPTTLLQEIDAQHPLGPDRRAAMAGPGIDWINQPAQRRPLSAHLPHDEVVHPAPCRCPSCGGALSRIGENVTETLDYVPGALR
jgi:hypothetical protein